MTIGITGSFADNNFGDYTMLLNDIYDLDDAGVVLDKIIIFCYEAEFVRKLCADYFLDYNTEIFEIKTKIEKAGQNAFLGIDKTSDCPTPLEILQSIENIDSLRSLVSECDLIVSCGGGHFDYYWLGLKRRYRLFSIVAPSIIARQMNIPRVMFGHSFGPWGNNKEFFQNLFNYIQFDLINCRDNLYSKKYLNAICMTENVHEVCDDLAVINAKIDSRPVKLNFNGYYIVDIYSSIQDIEHNIDSIVSFTRRMKETRKLKPLFVPHGPGYNGTRQAELLKRYISDLEIYTNDKGYLLPEEFLHLLKGAEFILCEHYHSFVLATTHKVPAIMFIRKIDGSHFYYYNKTVGFLKISGVLEKSETGEEPFCVLSLPDLFESSEIEMRIGKIKSILRGIDFSKNTRKKDYMKLILKNIRGGGTTV